MQVIQQIFAVGNPRHVKLLTQAMQGHVLLLAQHCYGCRIVQKVKFLVLFSFENHKIMDIIGSTIL